MKLYITDLSLFVLIIFYLPFVLLVLWRVLRKSLPFGRKMGMAALIVVIAYAIPLGDVTINSIAMAKVCPSAGLHIYRTVEVEGYLTDIGDGDILKKHPYRFIERPQLNVDGTYDWIHYEKQPDGTVFYGRLDQPTAEYEVAYEQWHVDKKRGVESSAYVVRNRLSGEVLAERNLFNPLPGWLDKILVYRWFGIGGRDGCHGAPSAGIDESMILIPKQSNN
jgi:hypothetical protein